MCSPDNLDLLMLTILHLQQRKTGDLALQWLLLPLKLYRDTLALPSLQTRDHRGSSNLVPDNTVTADKH